MTPASLIPAARGAPPSTPRLLDSRPSTPRLSAAGFTLVELLIGLTLSLIVISAVLSSYAFLGRNLTRLAHQQTLETEARRTLQLFAQDSRTASGVTSPSASAVTFNVPTATGTTTVAYNYYTSATTVMGVAVPAYSLTRAAPAGSAPQILLRDLVPFSFTFRYYDGRGREYLTPTSTNYRIGLKQVSMEFISRTGSGANGTLTPSYYGASPRLALRNSPLPQ